MEYELTSNMQPQTTIGVGLSQTASDAEAEAEEEDAAEDEELEEQQTLIGRRQANGNTTPPPQAHLTSSSCKDSIANQSGWPLGILYFLSTLAVVGIVAIVSPFSPIVISIDARDSPTMDSSSPFPLDETTTALEVELNNKDVKQQQISNYIKGTAIIRNIHITHHAGTSLCGQMSRLGPTPGFACGGKGTLDHPWPSEEALANSHFTSANPSHNGKRG
mmetsp:Transcript_18084/g.28369  ORF Transcript_18084/g.28369 Transcript_18084/m.28369 type:complete len:219 (-) Transcript_18084:2058-2714(-)